MNLKVIEGGNDMERNKEVAASIPTEKESYNSALFSTLLFVGGTIVAFIILLLVLFITRI